MMESQVKLRPASDAAIRPADERVAAEAAGPRPASRSLSQDAASVALGAVLSQGATVLALVFLARIVSPAELGTYQQLSLLYGIAAPFLLGGVPAALLYFIPRSGTRHEQGAWLKRAYGVLIATGLVAMVLTFLARDELAGLFHNRELAPALALYAPYVLFAFVFAGAPNALIALRRSRLAAAINGCNGVCLLVGVVVAALVQPDARALALGLTVAGAVSALISILVVKRARRSDAPAAANVAKVAVPVSLTALVAYGLPLALSGLAARIGYQFDRVVVSTHFSSSDFAVYSLGATELPISLLIQSAVASVLAPVLAMHWQSGDTEAFLHRWRQAIRKTALVVAPLFAFFMADAGDVVHTLYGQKYDGAVVLFRIYLVFMPLRIATWGLIPQAIGRTRTNLNAAWIILLCNIVLALMLVGPLGLKGPALAAPLSAYLASVYYLVAIRRATRIPVRRLLPGRHIVGCFLVAGAVALPVALVIGELPLPALVRLGLTFVVSGCAYVLVARRVQLIGPADWKRVSGITRLPFATARAARAT